MQVPVAKFPSNKVSINNSSASSKVVNYNLLKLPTSKVSNTSNTSYFTKVGARVQNNKLVNQEDIRKSLGVNLNRYIESEPSPKSSNVQAKMDTIQDEGEEEAQDLLQRVVM